MTNLTDYEINLRLARIAGPEQVWRSVEPFQDLRKFEMCRNEDDDEVQVRAGDWYVGDWDPVHDWLQMGPLADRFIFQVMRIGDDPEALGYECLGIAFPEPGEWTVVRGAIHEDLRRAMASAIVAAHEEPEHG